MHDCQILIIGSGLAGASLALRLAKSGQKVTILTKQQSSDGASSWAQGGIAAVIDERADLDKHVADTLATGCGLSASQVVRTIAESAADCIDWLIDLGIEFTYQDNRLHLTREGGHSERRVVHAGDTTGQAIQKVLLQHLVNHPNIRLVEHVLAIDLITNDKVNLSAPRCYGVYGLNTKTNQVETWRAPITVLSTGGVGKVYMYTTNPDTSTGDGIAMAWRAGASVANMEFVQFHPTCLYHNEVHNFLISEVVRGEGGILRLPNGYRFMPAYDNRSELAPRDLVARAIDNEMKRHGLEHVLLDVTHLGRKKLMALFPSIYQRCLQLGYDMAINPLPVVPAAHYTCGGVVVKSNGQTDLPGLIAIGEVAHTGLHGANRLASNSLLECLVMAQHASAHILKNISHLSDKMPAIQDWDTSQVTDLDEAVVVLHNWKELRRFMWNYVGIVRTDKRLLRAKNRIALLKQEINEFYAQSLVNADLLELRNLVLCAELIVNCALQRHENLGLHYNRDYQPASSDVTDTILIPQNAVASANAQTTP